MKYLADIDLAPQGGFKGFGPLGFETAAGSPIQVFAKFISSAVGLMTIVAIIWFIFTFFIGAIGIITAGSDKQALESSRKKIAMGLTGFVVVIVSIFIIRFIGTLLGIPQILDLSGMYELLKIGP